MEEISMQDLPSTQIRIKRVLEVFSEVVCSRNLLDIGCGDGTVTKQIREIVNLDIVDGVDVLDSPDRPDWIRFKRVDLNKESLPYPSDSFDTIYCGEVIEHMVDPDHLLDEIYRVLSPVGKCILTTPNLGSWPSRFTLLLGFQPYLTSVSDRYKQVGWLKLVGRQEHTGHLRVFTTRALLELLKLHNFRVDRLKGWEVGNLGMHLHSSLLGVLVSPIDKLLALFPSLACSLTVVMSKIEVRV